MYQFNLRNIKVLSGFNWVRKIEAEQIKLRGLNSNRVGGFAIENNMVPNNGDHIRLVDPNKIWVFKLWRITATEIKSMIFKGLNIKLLSKTELDPSKEYLLLKPEYSGKEGQYVHHNPAIEYADQVEFKQPMYVVDITDFKYTVFFSGLDAIVTTNWELINLYNDGKEVNQKGLMLRKVKTKDNLFSAYTYAEPNEQFENHRELIIGVNSKSDISNLTSTPFTFSSKTKNEVTEKDYEAYFNKNHIIAPFARYASPEWILK